MSIKQNYPYFIKKQLKKNHPFFCHKKQCRKTFEDTPEYLNAEDIAFLKKIAKSLEDNDSNTFCNLIGDLDRNLVKAFFDRALGWPEGYTYCQSDSYVITTTFPSLIKRRLKAMKKFLREQK